MTDKQKQAIRVLNNIRAVSKALSEENYFLLLEFVVENQTPIYTIPFTQTDPQPLDPVYGKFGKVTGTVAEPTMQGKSASTGLSYGEKLIMENKSPI